jgi:hypothetical protein
MFPAMFGSDRLSSSREDERGESLRVAACLAGIARLRPDPRNGRRAPGGRPVSHDVESAHRALYWGKPDAGLFAGWPVPGVAVGDGRFP